MTTRDSDALQLAEASAKWGATGDVASPESVGITRTEGYGPTYSQPGGDLPEREVFNQILRELTALAVELNQHGILPWDGSIPYIHPAMVWGSNDLLYASVRNSTGVDPTTDTTEADWVRYRPATTPTVDFSNLTGTAALNQLPTIPTSKISGLQVTRRVTSQPTPAQIAQSNPGDLWAQV